MKNNEIIVVDSIPSESYDMIVKSSFEYALLSLPFTINRMSIDDIEYRILNIAKGKIAEGLFEFFCNENNILIDTKRCQTEFWKVDKKDFILNNIEWDIKNNYIYTNPNQKINYVDLPALIPNRHPNDQWGRRIHNLHLGTSPESAFVFTFIKNADVVNGTRKSEFVSTCFNEKQIAFLNKIHNKYNGLPIEAQPFEPQEYIDRFFSLSDDTSYSLVRREPLYITGIAQSKDWELFKDTGPRTDNNYIDYINPHWYMKSRSGSINFMDHVLWTKIVNKTVPISFLESFHSFIKHNSDYNYASLYNG
jgi:hypothetical protein